MRRKTTDFITIARLRQCDVDLEFLSGFKSYEHVAHSPERPISGKAHAQYMGQASNLLTDILIAKGEPNDVMDAILYCFCICDARKYNLDISDAKEKYRYKELRDKNKKTV